MEKGRGGGEREGERERRMREGGREWRWSDEGRREDGGVWVLV